jgi:hypothetical protein
VGRVLHKMHSRKRHGADVFQALRSDDTGNVWRIAGHPV